MFSRYSQDPGHPCAYAGQTITVQHSGLREIFVGHQAAHFFGVSYSD